MITLAVATAGLLAPALLPAVPGRKPWGLLPEETLLSMLTAVASVSGTLRTALVNGAHVIPVDFRLSGASAGGYGAEIGSTGPVCIITSGQYVATGVTTGSALQTEGRTYYVIADDPLPAGFCRLTLSEDNPL